MSLSDFYPQNYPSLHEIPSPAPLSSHASSIHQSASQYFTFPSLHLHTNCAIHVPYIIPSLRRDAAAAADLFLAINSSANLTLILMSSSAYKN